MKRIIWWAIAKCDRKVHYRHHSGQWSVVLDRPWMLWATVIGPYIGVYVIAGVVLIALQAIT